MLKQQFCLKWQDVQLFKINLQNTEIKQIMFTVMKRNHYIKTWKYHDSLRKKIWKNLSSIYLYINASSVTHDWSHSNALHSSPVGQFIWKPSFRVRSIIDMC
jgi:hypothetical protein